MSGRFGRTNEECERDFLTPSRYNFSQVTFKRAALK